MSRSARMWVFGIAGVAVLIAAPILAFDRPVWLWVIVPALVAWTIWLTAEYMRWVKTLGRR